ncbi:protein kinase domain-containing protein [Nocardia yamanashiensis]|uniref:protein kinase domain-containing protein n=1 Tax=Nocardia yamanashiensis TaxID=209247 RepID=UPI0009FDFD3A|nr:protein kinase [Nocardia yamanashiensis]
MVGTAWGEERVNSVLRAGEVFAGYQILRKLGAGGMGAVYQARDRDLPRFVALKLLTVPEDGDPEHRVRFRREADAVARLEHPNIVTVYARGEERGRLWIAMTFVDGSDVAVALRNGAMNPVRAVRILGETAAALDHAHEKGILHRDVKPGNILLTDGRGERALLTDFGIAKTMDESRQLTRQGEVLASFQYAAPERLTKAGQGDHRGDVYSLGCTFFHMVTGQLPYPGDNVGRIVYGHAYQPVPMASRQNPALPTGFDEVIARAMAKEPERRFATCSEFARAAEQSLRLPGSGAFTRLPRTGPNPAIAGPRTGPRATTARPPTGPNATTMGPGTIPQRPATETRLLTPQPWTAPVPPIPPRTTTGRNRDEHDGPGAPDDDRRRRWWIVVALGIALALVLVGYQQVGTRSGGTAATTTPQPLPATTQPSLTTTAEPVTTTPEPQPTTTAKQPTTTTTSVAPQPEKVEIPDVVGNLFTQAKAKLEKLGFVVVQAEIADKTAKGTVVSIDPAAGTTATAGSKITVSVSTGPATTTVKMPDLSGLTPAQAAAALKEKGIQSQPQQTEVMVTNPTQVGKIVSQTPAAGSDVATDANVTVGVGKLVKSSTVPVPTS